MFSLICLRDRIWSHRGILVLISFPSPVYGRYVLVSYPVKVEATKFTEVGYHGRDVDQIIRDLMDVSMQLTRRIWTEKLRAKAVSMVEDRILDKLTGPRLGGSSTTTIGGESDRDGGEGGEKKSSLISRSRESICTMLREGMLDDQVIEVNVPVAERSSGDFTLGGRGDDANPQIISMSDIYQRLSGGGSPKKQTEVKKMPIAEAKKVIEDIELDKLLETVDIKKEAITAVEQSGIVFIDEM